MSGIQTITIAFLIMALAAGALVTTLASLYDIKQTKRYRNRSKHPYSRRFRARPRIAIVVKANDNQDGLRKCLLSIAANRYRKYGIVVVAPAKNRAAQMIVDDFIQIYPKKSVCRVGDNKLAAVIKELDAKLVLVLSKPVILDKHALKKAVLWFSDDNQAQILLASQQVLADATLVNLVKRFEVMILSQMRKTIDLIGSTTSTSVDLAAIYKFNAFKSRSKQTAVKHYAADIAVYQPVERWRETLFVPQPTLATINLLGLILFSGLVFLISYATYLALWRVTVYPLAILWLSVSVFLFLAIWADEHQGLFEKAKLSLIAPIMFGLLYLSLLTGLLMSLVTPALTVIKRILPSLVKRSYSFRIW